jgi:SAM-dependent methyltransferase
MMRGVGSTNVPAGTDNEPGEPDWLEHSYDAFPRLEEAFNAALAESLQPCGPELLYDLVREMELPSGSSAADIGCGEGTHTYQLAERFQFSVTGIDPLPRHIEIASTALASLAPEVASLVQFAQGAAEGLPIGDATVDLVWCRDVLVHVADLDRAYSEFRRVLRPNGRALVYQMFAGERLEAREADWLWKTMGVVPTSADAARTDATISAAGFRVDKCAM